jgi:LytS/YehU family sensor histidine kinase
LLQAQIEPHFLFNTLSNVISLLETDPPKGRTMLADLTGYLRSSLSRTRDKMTTLGQEIDLIRAYLDIYKIRIADRLSYAIDIPDALRTMPFPPMLVQPLVENAVKHGIEPKIDGGRIVVSAENDSGCCRLVVADTGVGLSEQAIDGIGLANVKARVEALFHGKARLVLEQNRPCGLKVILEIPHG